MSIFLRIQSGSSVEKEAAVGNEKAVERIIKEISPKAKTQLVKVSTEPCEVFCCVSVAVARGSEDRDESVYAIDRHSCQSETVQLTFLSSGLLPFPRL